MERTCWYIILAYISCAYCTPYYYRESKQHSEHHREYSSEGSSGHDSPAGLEGTEALQFSPKPVPEKYYSGLYPTLGSSPLQSHSSGYSYSSGSLYQAPVAVTHASMQQGSVYQSPLTVSHGSASMYQSPVTVTRLTAQPVFYSSPPAGNVVVRKIVKVYKYPATGTQSGYVQVVQSKSGSDNLGREIYGQNIGSDLTLGQKEIDVKNVEGLFGKYFQGGDHPGSFNKEITMVQEHGGRGESLYGRRADSLETGQKEVSEEFGQQPVEENYETGQREESLYPVENKKLELGQREESFHHSEHFQVGQKEESLYPIQKNEKVQLGQQVTSIYARKPGEPLELGQKEEISDLEVGQKEESLYHSSHSGREFSIQGSAQKEQSLYPILPAHSLELGQREESTNIDLGRKEESLYHSSHSSNFEVGQKEESSGLELPQKEESLYSNSRRGDSEPGETEEPSSGQRYKESSHSSHRVVMYQSPTVYYSNQNSFSPHPQNGKTDNLDLGQREESSSFELGQREEGLQGLGGSHNSEIGQREESFSQHGLEVGQREESFSQHGLELGQKEEPLGELGQKEETLSGHYIELGQKEEPLELGQKEESLSGQHIELGQKEESFGGKYIELGQREEPVNEQHFELGQKEESISGQHIELGQKEESFSAGDFEVGQREEPLSGQHIDLGQKEEPLSGRHIELGQKEESFSGSHFELGQKEESYSGGHFELGQKEEPFSGSHFELGQREEPLTGKYSTFSTQKENKNEQSGNFHVIQRPVVVSSVTQVGKISKLEYIGGSGVNSQSPVYQGGYSAQGITCEHGHRHSHGGYGTGQRGHYLQIMQNGESNRGSSPNQIRDKNYKSQSGIYDIGQKEESLDLEHVPNNDKSIHGQRHEEYHEVSVVKSQTSSHRSVAGLSPDETSTRKAFPVFPVSARPNRGSGINLNKKIEDLAMELELESIARKPSIPRDSLSTTLEDVKREEVTTRSTTPVHNAEIQELGLENFNRRTTSDLSGFGGTPESRINVHESRKEEISVNYPESRRTYSKKHSRQYSARSESQSIVVPAKIEEYSVQSQGSSGAYSYRQGYSSLQGAGYVNDQPVQQQQMSKTEFLGSSQQGNKHAVIDEFLSELEKDIARSGGKRTQTGYVQVSSQQQPASSGTSLYSERTHTSQSSHSSSSSSTTGSGDKSWFQKVGDKIGSSYNKAVDKIGTTYSQAKEKAKEIVDSVKQKAGY